MKGCICAGLLLEGKMQKHSHAIVPDTRDFPSSLLYVYLGITNRNTNVCVEMETLINIGHCSQSDISVVLILFTCTSMQH